MALVVKWNIHTHRQTIIHDNKRISIWPKKQKRFVCLFFGYFAWKQFVLFGSSAWHSVGTRKAYINQYISACWRWKIAQHFRIRFTPEMNRWERCSLFTLIRKETIPWKDTFENSIEILSIISIAPKTKFNFVKAFPHLR